MRIPLLRRPLAIIAVLAVLLALGGSVRPPAAHASGTLTITLVDCTSGNSHFECTASVSGGVTPYSYTWQAISNATITSNLHSSYALGVCTSGQFSSVKATVQDSVGATVAKTGGTICRSAPWQ